MGVEKDIWHILQNASTVDIKDAKTRQEQLDRAKAVNEADVVVVTRCKDCKKHNKEVCIDVPYKEDACPLISWRGKAQGHEFDYQYCPYGERK